MCSTKEKCYMTTKRTEEELVKQREYNKRYYQQNKEQIKQKVSIWKELHPDNVKKHTKTYRETHPIQYILKRAKNRAILNNLEFNITEEDILIPKVCPYLKIPLTFNLTLGHQDSNISLDRIDNNKGYIKGNVEIISHLANKMKSNATWQQLEAFSSEVLQRVSKR